MLDVSNPARPQVTTQIALATPTVPAEALRLSEAEQQICETLLEFTAQSVEALLEQPANPSSLYTLQVMVQMIGTPGMTVNFNTRQGLADLCTFVLHLARHAENPGIPPHLPVDRMWLAEVTELQRALLNRELS